MTEFKSKTVADLLGSRASSWGDVPISTPSEAADIIALQSTIRALPEGDERVDALKTWLAELVAVCTPLDANTATQVLALEGWWNSELAQKCLRAVGLDSDKAEGAEQTGDINPTS